MQSTRNPYLRDLYFRFQIEHAAAPRLIEAIRRDIPYDFRPQLAVQLGKQRMTIYMRDIEHSIYCLLVSLAHGGEETTAKAVGLPDGAWVSGADLDHLLAAAEPLPLLQQLAQERQSQQAPPAPRRRRRIAA